jgi:hypothetical protein
MRGEEGRKEKGKRKYRKMKRTRRLRLRVLPFGSFFFAFYYASHHGS